MSACPKLEANSEPSPELPLQRPLSEVRRLQTCSRVPFLSAHAALQASLVVPFIIPAKPVAAGGRQLTFQQTGSDRTYLLLRTEIMIVFLTVCSDTRQPTYKETMPRSRCWSSGFTSSSSSNVSHHNATPTDPSFFHGIQRRWR